MERENKLLIICLDGLDYYLTLKWKISKLLQKIHGRFYVGDIRILYTPLIWSSILCGFSVEEKGYGYEEAVRRSMGTLRVLHDLKKKIFGEKRFWIIRRLLIFLRLLRANFIMPTNLLRETFLEILEDRGYKVFALEVPGYNEINNGRFRLKMHELILSKKLEDRMAFIKEVKNDTINRLNKTQQALETYDVVMCYSPLPDLAHHLFLKGIKSRILIYKTYRWLEKNVNKYLLKPAYDLNFNVLILSDHGFDMKNFTHSNYAFWSSNVELSRPIKTYRDVKDNILNMLRGKNVEK